MMGVSLLTTGFLCQRASAQITTDTYFSIDNGSPSTAWVSPSDILAPGTPDVSPPAIAYPYTSLGLVAGDDMRDFTWGDAGTLYFSVDRTSAGVIGTAVNGQWLLNQAAGDVFTSPLNGENFLTYNQNLLSLIPLVGPSVNNTITPIDNMDGLSFIHNPAYSPAYALAPGSPTLGSIGGTASDIFYSPSGIPSILVSYDTLGLNANDVIEGLAHIGGPGYTSGEWLITLAPGSPTLTTLDATSSDILGDYANETSPFIDITYGDLGLLAGDNVDAIALVPEPSSALLIGFGILAICGVRRFPCSRRQS
jgi:hypothetical protein